MASQPVAAAREQLVHLVGSDPVVLGAVEDGHEDVEVGEQLAQPSRAREMQRAEARIRRRFQLDRPAERLEQAAHEARIAAQGQRRHRRLQGDGGLGQFRALRAASVERRAQRLGDGDGEKRRGRVGAIVDVLRDGRAPPAHQGHRVHVERQHEAAQVRARVRIGHHRPAEGKRRLVHPVGVLVQKEAQIGGGRVRGGDRQEHAARMPRPRAPINRRCGGEGGSVRPVAGRHSHRASAGPPRRAACWACTRTTRARCAP